MNLEDAYNFGMWVSLDRLEKSSIDGLDIYVIEFAKKRLMKIICMGDSS